MADLRIAAGSLLTTVSTVADTATALVTSVGTAANMLNDMASNAHWQQKQRIKVSKVGFEDNLKVTHGLEIIRNRKVLKDYIDENPDQKDDLTAILAELEAALA